MSKVVISNEIFKQYQGYNAVVIYAVNIKNAASNQYSEQILRSAEKEFYESYHNKCMELAKYPHFTAWRKAYATFGAKPNKHLCSAENLSKTVIAGGKLPRINLLVDLYNAVSLKYSIPIGGEDLNELKGNVHLGIAQGNEEFISKKGLIEHIDHPRKGEVIYWDNLGVTCRRWNWQQCSRTAITEKTTNACFILESLPPLDLGRLKQASYTLCEQLMCVCPNLKLQAVYLRETSAETISLTESCH